MVFGDEAPIHEVTINNFYLSSHETTVALKLLSGGRSIAHQSGMGFADHRFSTGHRSALGWF
jgi:hypothetical protein